MSHFKVILVLTTAAFLPLVLFLWGCVYMGLTGGRIIDRDYVSFHHGPPVPHLLAGLPRLLLSLAITIPTAILLGLVYFGASLVAKFLSLLLDEKEKTQ